LENEKLQVAEVALQLEARTFSSFGQASTGAKAGFTVLPCTEPAETVNSTALKADLEDGEGRVGCV